MAGPEGVLRKVLELKEQLSQTQDPSKLGVEQGSGLESSPTYTKEGKKAPDLHMSEAILNTMIANERVTTQPNLLGLAQVMKALKGLQVLEITLGTLEETGIRKIINSFRKHLTVGNLAKSLICHWKKLLPQDHASETPKRKNIKGKDSSVKNKRKLSLKENNRSEKPQIPTSSRKILPSSDKQKKPHRLKDKQRKEDSGISLSHLNEEQSNNFCQNFPGGLEMNSFEHINKKQKERHKSSKKPSSSKTSNKCSKKNHSSPDERKDSSRVEKYGEANMTKTGSKRALKLNSQAKSPSNEAFEPPTMSFESYLNYDQVSSSKKRKACPASKQNVNSNSVSQKSVALSFSKKEEKALQSDDLLEIPIKKAKTSIQDLLNVPLPKILPELFISSPPCAAEFKVLPAVAVPQERCDTVEFTGQRVNSKMQVYSGSKTVYLSKLLTLYEQCIRVLQNNIDSLCEVGRVPFELLEPVLTCCTSEQLFRIEAYNSMFIEQSDHLWKKHCQRNFRNERPLEDESWREMYLRVYSQREEKLKFLTTSIRLAQSEKPKGRRVKMAFVHCKVKPHRNVRHQEEIYGTTGSIQSEMTHLKNGESDNISAIFNKGRSPASTGTNQDGKKASKKMAPIMKKSLIAFKSRVGPR